MAAAHDDGGGAGRYAAWLSRNYRRYTNASSTRDQYLGEISVGHPSREHEEIVVRCRGGFAEG